MKFEHYQRNFLEKRIYYRMKHLNLEYHNQYITYIKKHPDEIDLFLDKFTINYTYFFRNYSVFENFEKFILIYAKHVKRTLKIWSAPSATGDEPYSIAILLDHLKNQDKNFPDFMIVASDIDKNAIKIAKEGSYREYAIHETPEFYLQTYFTKKETTLGPQYTINKNIKNKVEFIQEDIIKGHEKNQKYDVIFCRNFFIYINQYAREKLSRILETRLHDGGLLILGGSEALSTKNATFENINIRDRFYIKNLATQNELYKRGISNLFEKRITKRLPKKSRSKPQKKEVNKLIENVSKKNPEIEVNNSLIKVFNVPVKRDTHNHTSRKDKVKYELHEESKEVKKIQKNEEIEKTTKITAIKPAEVRITELLVNNGSNGSSPSNKKSLLADRTKYDINQAKISAIKKREKYTSQREEALKHRELRLERREKIIEQRSIYLETKKKKLELRREKIKNVLKYAKQKEKEASNRMRILDQLTKQVEQQERLVKQREKQLQRRFNQARQYSSQVIQREIQININSKEIELKEESEELISQYEEKRLDKVETPNYKNEIVIPMGYYSLINSFDKNQTATKLSIQGLGSGIGLILKDPLNNIFAMSHISLPNSSSSKQGYHLLFPHTFADTSVKDLYNNLLYYGAKKSNIKATIVGGAKLFLDYDMTYQENIDNVKKELISREIEIETEDIGGLSERSVIYDTINDVLYVKKTWEFEYRLIA